MNLQEIGQVQFDARISVAAEELYNLCSRHEGVVLSTAHVLPQQGPTYEDLVAATLKHCQQAVIVPRDRVVEQWARDRRWEVSKEEFDATHPNAAPTHWFAYKAEINWRSRASVLESIAHCLVNHPTCVFYEHGMNVNGQPYKACRHGMLRGQTFNAFEY